MIEMLLAAYPSLRALRVDDAISEAKYQAKQYRKDAPPDSLAARTITDLLAALEPALVVTTRACGGVRVDNFLADARAGRLPADVRVAWEVVAANVGIKLV